MCVCFQMCVCVIAYLCMYVCIYACPLMNIIYFFLMMYTKVMI